MHPKLGSPASPAPRGSPLRPPFLDLRDSPLRGLADPRAVPARRFKFPPAVRSRPLLVSLEISTLQGEAAVSSARLPLGRGSTAQTPASRAPRAAVAASREQEDNY